MNPPDAGSSHTWGEEPCHVEGPAPVSPAPALSVFIMVIRGSRGKVSVRTFGKKRWRMTLVHSAPATDTYNFSRLRTVYVNGKLR